VLGIVLRRAEELAAMSEELQRSNKELEAFSYSVSHDLRAPFRHIVGYANLLKTREGAQLSDKGRHYVETIIEAAFSAGTLVDSLLSFSQMGRHALNKVWGDMNALVEEVRRKVLRDVTPDRTLRWEIAPLGRAYADPVMLRLVIENLLSNAVKYTRGTPEAVIAMGSLPPREGEAVYFVRDNVLRSDEGRLARQQVSVREHAPAVCLSSTSIQAAPADPEELSAIANTGSSRCTRHRGPHRPQHEMSIQAGDPSIIYRVVVLTPSRLC
jgi:light-regulated signal transduction histidine kinase (bacteriophytochrome)